MLWLLKTMMVKNMIVITVTAANTYFVLYVRPCARHISSVSSFNSYIKLSNENKEKN